MTNQLYGSGGICGGDQGCTNYSCKYIKVKNCINYGQINGQINEYSGGICGSHFGEINDYSEWYFGNNYVSSQSNMKAKITNCVNKGSILNYGAGILGDYAVSGFSINNIYCNLKINNCYTYYGNICANKPLFHFLFYNIVNYSTLVIKNSYTHQHVPIFNSIDSFVISNVDGLHYIDTKSHKKKYINLFKNPTYISQKNKP